MSSFRTTAARLAVAAALTVGVTGATTMVADALPNGGSGGTVVGPVGPGHPEVGDIDDLTVYDPCVSDAICDPGPTDPGDDPEVDPGDPTHPDDPGTDPGSQVDPAVVAHPTFTG